MRRGSALGAWLTLGVLALAGCTQNDPVHSSRSATATASVAPQGDGRLVIATLSGAQGAAGAAQRAAVKVAVGEINAAGGVNGSPVSQVDVTDTSATPAVSQLSTAKADAVVGTPATSEEAAALVAAKSVVFEPTAAVGESSDGMIVRMTPDAAVLTGALGSVIEADGHKSLAVLAAGDGPGKSVAKALTADLAKDTGNKVELATDPVLYSPASDGFTVEVTKIKGAKPDAVVLAGGQEISRIVPELAIQRLGPADLATYLVGAGATDHTDLAAGALKGAKAVRPGTGLSEQLKQRLVAVDPTLTDFSGAEQAYDATVLIALAAQASKDDAGPVLAKQVDAVAEKGSKCTTAEACLSLAKSGKDLRYVGASGALGFDAAGRRTVSSATVADYDDANRLGATTLVTVN